MKTYRSKYFLLIVFSIVLIALLVGGCGGGKEIKIGAPMPLTGPYASDGEQMNMALQMAIDEWNAKGGLLGRQLKLIPGDVGALEAEKIKAVGERLIGEDVDVLITGYADSGVDARVFGEYDMPFLHGDAMTLSTEIVAQNPEKYGNVFQFTPNEVQYGDDTSVNLFKTAEEMGWMPPNNKIAIIKADYSYNILAADRFRDRSKEKGYEIVVDEVTQFGVVEWGPILSKIEQTQPSYVTFWNLDPTDAARFMIQFVEKFGENGINALVFMQYTPNIPEFIELAGEAAEGLLWTTSVGLVGTGVKEYEARWVEKYGDGPKSVYSYITRDAFEIWATSVEKAGCVDCYDQVIKNIREIEYSGFAGVYKFNPVDQSILPGEDLIPTVWLQIWDGTNHIIGPGKFKEADVRLPPWIK